MIATRNHLSWSQMQIWEKGEQEYYDCYILGERHDNKYTRFGKRIHSGLEQGKTNDPEVEFCRIYVPTPAKREALIKVTMESIPLLMKADGVTRGKKPIIDEFKTGKNAWTQKQADSHGQLTFYDMIFWQKYGIIPGNRLTWIPTVEDEKGNINVSGEIPITFETERTLTDIAKMFTRAKKAWDGIQEFCKNL